MSSEKLRAAVVRQLGDPGTVIRELRDYRRSAKALSASHPGMIDQYPKQWVVVHQGKVKARGQTLQSALLQAERKRLPTEHSIVRFIDRDERTFIL